MKSAQTMENHTRDAPTSGTGEESASSQSSAMSICMSDTTPESQTTTSAKNTCLKRKKKSRSCAFDHGDLEWLGGSSQEQEEDTITKRLEFGDIDLSDDETEKKTESAKKRREKLPVETVRTPAVKRSRSSSDAKPKTPSLPIRNTCILESPLDQRKTSRKHRIYGVRRNEPQLPRIRPKRSAKRPVRSALCALQRMFADS